MTTVNLLNIRALQDPSNRSHGNYQLEKLIEQIVRKWSEVEFMTSTELGELLNKK